VRAYAGEMYRVLNDDGVAVVSFHHRPAHGHPFSGTEDRADYDREYFEQIFNESGFMLLEDVGDVCGQQTLVLQKRHMGDAALNRAR